MYLPAAPSTSEIRLLSSRQETQRLRLGALDLFTHVFNRATARSSHLVQWRNLKHWTPLPQVVHQWPQLGLCRVDVDLKSAATQLPDSVLRTSSKSFDPLPTEAPAPPHPTPSPRCSQTYCIPKQLCWLLPSRSGALHTDAREERGVSCVWKNSTVRLLRLQGRVLVRVSAGCTAGGEPSE